VMTASCQQKRQGFGEHSVFVAQYDAHQAPTASAR
jgi:hypothetical protein